ncbi:MAG: hypothetical protein GWQ05_07950 [Verrucomicrobiaceae bacterium]|nr:hypothetical protein [Verrucomicrobiaceae bacterium]
MLGDLSKEVDALDDATEKVKALAIRARSRRGGSNSDEREQLTSSLVEALNRVVTAAEGALEKLNTENAS